MAVPIANQIADLDALLEVAPRQVVLAQAHILGTLNVLPAKVVGPGEGCVEIASQPLRVKGPLEAAIGSHLTIALRPEVFSLNGAYGTTAKLASHMTNNPLVHVTRSSFPVDRVLRIAYSAFGYAIRNTR